MENLRINIQLSNAFSFKIKLCLMDDSAVNGGQFTLGLLTNVLWCPNLATGYPNFVVGKHKQPIITSQFYFLNFE